jgi:hypothetical protein
MIDRTYMSKSSKTDDTMPPAEAPAPDLISVLATQSAELTRLTAEVERLRAALEGMIDMSQYWINLASERGMSKERWLALGHHSNAMQKARAALKEPRT